jgi:hypothetical protein
MVSGAGGGDQSMVSTISSTLMSGHLEMRCEGSIRADRPLAMHDLVDSARRHADIFRQLILADPEWLQKFFEQHFTRMDRWQLVLGHYIFPLRHRHIQHCRVANSTRAVGGLGGGRGRAIAASGHHPQQVGVLIDSRR